MRLVRVPTVVGDVRECRRPTERSHRAIEPDHLASTAYSWFLPATYSAYTFPEISISNYLLRNVAVLAQLKDA